MAQKAKVKAAEIGEEVKDIYGDAKEKVQEKIDARKGGKDCKEA